MAGIGKTELARKFGEQLESYSKFWIECQNDTSVESILMEVAKGLDKSKASLIDSVISSSRTVSSINIGTLASILDEVRGVLFLDSYERVKSPNVEHLITNIGTRISEARVIITSRVNPNWARAVSIDPNEKGLEGLDENASKELMQRLGLHENEESLSGVYEKLKGHPKLIELFSYWGKRLGIETAMKELPEASAEISNYLLTEIFSGLNEQEKNLLSRMAVYRSAIPLEGIKVVYEEANLGEVLAVLIDSFLISRRESGDYNIHELAREFYLAKSEGAETAHEKASRYFLSRSREIAQENYRDYIEAYYHLQQARRYDDAVKLVADIAEKMESWCFWDDLETMLNESLNSLVKDNSETKGIVLRLLGVLHRRRGEYVQALEGLGQALEIMQQQENKPEIARLYDSIGITYARLGRYLKAEEMYERSLGFYKQLSDQLGMSKIYNNIGVLYSYQGKHSEALQMYERTLEIKQKVGARLDATYTNIAYIHYSQGEYDRALQTYEKALEIRLELKDRWKTAYTYNDMGRVYLGQGKYDKALQMHHKSLRIHRQINQQPQMAKSYDYIGEVYHAQKEYTKALTMYKQSLEIMQRLDDQLGIAQVYNNIARAYWHQNEYDKALEIHHKSLEIYKHLEHPYGMAKTHLDLGKLYTSREEIQAARQHLEQALDICNESGITAILKEAKDELSKL